MSMHFYFEVYHTKDYHGLWHDIVSGHVVNALSGADAKIAVARHIQEHFGEEFEFIDFYEVCNDGSLTRPAFDNTVLDPSVPSIIRNVRVLRRAGKILAIYDHTPQDWIIARALNTDIPTAKNLLKGRTVRFDWENITLPEDEWSKYKIITKD